MECDELCSVCEHNKVSLICTLCKKSICSNKLCLANHPKPDHHLDKPVGYILRLICVKLDNLDDSCDELEQWEARRKHVKNVPGDIDKKVENIKNEIENSKKTLENYSKMYENSARIDYPSFAINDVNNVKVKFEFPIINEYIPQEENKKMPEQNINNEMLEEDISDTEDRTNYKQVEVNNSIERMHEFLDHKLNEWSKQTKQKAERIDSEHALTVRITELSLENLKRELINVENKKKKQEEFILKSSVNGKEEIKKRADYMNRITAENRNLEEINKKLKIEYDTLNGKIKCDERRFNEEIQNLKLQRDKYIRENSNLETKKKALDVDISNKNADIGRLASECKLKQNELKNCTSMLDSVKNQKETIVSENLKMNDKLETVKTNFHVESNWLENIRDKYSKMEANVKNLTNQKAILNKEVSDQEAQKKSLSDECKRLETKIENFKGSSPIFEKENANLETKNERLKEIKGSTINNLWLLFAKSIIGKRNYEAIEIDVNDKKEELKKLSEQIKEADKTFRSKTNDLKSLDEYKKKVDAKLGKAKEIMQKLTEANLEIKNQLKVKSLEIDYRVEEVNFINESLQKGKESLTKCVKELKERLLKHVSGLKIEANALENELTRYKNSFKIISDNIKVTKLSYEKFQNKISEDCVKMAKWLEEKNNLSKSIIKRCVEEKSIFGKNVRELCKKHILAFDLINREIVGPYSFEKSELTDLYNLLENTTKMTSEKFTKMIKEKDSEIKQFREEKDKLEKRIKEKEKIIDEFSDSIKDKEREIDSLKKLKIVQELRISGLIKIEEASRGKMGENSKEIENYEMNIQECNKSMNEISNKLKATQEESKKSEDNLILSNKKLEEADNTLRKTKEELNNVKIELDATKKELDKTKEESSCTKKELDTTKEDLSKTKKELDKTKEESNKTVAELNETKGKLDKATSKLDSTKEELCKTKKETKAKLDETRVNFNKSKEEFTKANEELSKMKKQLNTSELDKAKKDSRELIEQSIKTKEELKEIIEELSKSKKELNEIQERLSTIKEEQNVNQEEWQNTIKVLNKIKGKFTKANEESDKCKKELDIFMKKTNKTNEELKKPQEKLNKTDVELSKDKEKFTKVNEELDNAEEKLDNSKEEQKEITKKPNEINKELNNANEYSNKIRAEFAKANQDADKIKKESDNTEENLDNANEELREVQKKSNKIDEESDNISKNMNATQEESHKTQEELKIVKEELNKPKGLLDINNAQLEVLNNTENELKNYKTRLNMAKEQCNKAKEKIAEIKKEFNELNGALFKYETEYKDFSVESNRNFKLYKDKLKEANENSKESIARLEKDNRKFSDSLKKVKSDILRLSERNLEKLNEGQNCKNEKKSKYSVNLDSENESESLKNGNDAKSEDNGNRDKNICGNPNINETFVIAEAVKINITEVQTNSKSANKFNEKYKIELDKLKGFIVEIKKSFTQCREFKDAFESVFAKIKPTLKQTLEEKYNSMQKIIKTNAVNIEEIRKQNDLLRQSINEKKRKSEENVLANFEAYSFPNTGEVENDTKKEETEIKQVPENKEEAKDIFNERQIEFIKSANIKDLYDGIFLNNTHSNCKCKMGYQNYQRNDT